MTEVLDKNEGLDKIIFTAEQLITLELIADEFWKTRNETVSLMNGKITLDDNSDNVLKLITDNFPNESADFHAAAVGFVMGFSSDTNITSDLDNTDVDPFDLSDEELGNLYKRLDAENSGSNLSRLRTAENSGSDSIIPQP